MRRSSYSGAIASVCCSAAILSLVYAAGLNKAPAHSTRSAPPRDLLTYSHEELKLHAAQIFRTYVSGNAVAWENEDAGWRDQCDVILMDNCAASAVGTNKWSAVMHLLHSVENPPQDKIDKDALFRLPAQPPPEPPSISKPLQSIYYNESAASTIEQFGLNDPHVLATRLTSLQGKVSLDDQDIQDFKPDAVVVKTIWELASGLDHADLAEVGKKNYMKGIYLYNPAVARVDPKAEDIQLLRPRGYWQDGRIPGPYIDLDDTIKCSKHLDSGFVIYSLGCFYSRPIQPSDIKAYGARKNELPDLLVNNCSSGPCRMILVGVHIMTRETPNWVWMTFWWSSQWWDDNPGLTDVQEKWGLFDWDATVNNIDPVANPYLEGVVNGMNSNCLECHRHAVLRLNPGASPHDVGNGNVSSIQSGLTPRFVTAIAGGDMSQRIKFADHMPVAPIPPDLRNLQWPSCYFAEALQTHFLWTIALHGNSNSEIPADPCPKGP